MGGGVPKELRFPRSWFWKKCPFFHFLQYRRARFHKQFRAHYFGSKFIKRTCVSAVYGTSAYMDVRYGAFALLYITVWSKFARIQIRWKITSLTSECCSVLKPQSWELEGSRRTPGMWKSRDSWVESSGRCQIGKRRRRADSRHNRQKYRSRGWQTDGQAHLSLSP